MNRTKLLFAASAAMALTFADAANTYEVHTVAELTNACAKATANFDKILIYPGTYDLTGITMATETIGDKPAGSSTKVQVTSGIHLKLGTYQGQLLGMGKDPGDTIIKGAGESGKCRLLTTASSKYCTVSNLTFTGGYVAQTDASGGVYTGSLLTFTDCIFSNNYARNFGGVFDGVTTITRCRFINNSAGASGGVLRPVTSTSKPATQVHDSYFEGNHADSNGGISYYDCTWSNCVFVGNYAPNGGVFGGTVGRKTVATDCHFTNNYATSSSTAISDWSFNSKTYVITPNLVAATNCTFHGNGSSGNALFGGCDVVNCSFTCNTGAILIACSTLRNCRLVGNMGTHKNSNPLFGGNTFYNCLLARNRAGIHSMSSLTGSYSETVPSYLYNCTVVSNEYIATNYSIVQGGTCVNTILADNCLYGADWITASRQDLGGPTYASPLMTNCLWTAQRNAPSAEKAIGGGLVTDAQLRFTDAANGDYTIQRKSVAQNAGWSDAAYLESVGPYDLKGDPRVFAHDISGVQIDVGAYECCILAKGFMFMLQ